MAYLEIPVQPQLLAFREKVVLDGTNYTLAGRWNSRMARWIMDFMTEDGTPLLLGCPVLANWNLTSLYKGRIAGFPRGDFFSFDFTGQARIPDLNSFGNDVKLMYLEARG